MLGFNIADLVTEQDEFDIPSSFGKWEFRKNGNYVQITKAMEKGMCGNTFTAFHSEATERLNDDQFHSLCGEIIDANLILSFITAKCVTVSGSAAFSCPMFIQLGDHFLQSRAIRGFKEIESQYSYNQIFSSGIPTIQTDMQSRNLRIFLSHWISGLTCFTIEDLFLAACVQMDIVKQCEILPSDNRLYYFDGMIRASRRYGISPLSRDFTNMRNDLVHEGKLSGSNNPNKSKSDCSSIIADVLNWIDEYVLKVLSLQSFFTFGNRWSSREIESFLPAISI